jgi:uncharacterized protein
MKRLILLICAILPLGTSIAQQAPVPAYTNVHVITGLHQAWTVPRAQALMQASSALSKVMQTYCGVAAGPTTGLNTVRTQWQTTVAAWDTLSAVAVGPIIERRSSRAIDFAPARPVLIEKAIAAQPASSAEMERIGTPAKGFNALEWLLWVKPATPNTPACRYAMQVAADIEREAQALQAAFTPLASTSWAEATQTNAAMSELVNQWIGALERLQWAQMGKPLKSAQGKVITWPRGASSTAAQTWSAQWLAIRTLSSATAGQPFPVPGQGLVPLELYLRGKGQNPLADQLASAVIRVDQHIKKLNANTRIEPGQVQITAEALRALKQFAESTLAPGLNVTIGFSDNDGD